MPNLRGASPVGRGGGDRSCVTRADGRCGRAEVTRYRRWSTGDVMMVNARGRCGNYNVASCSWGCLADHRDRHLKLVMSRSPRRGRNDRPPSAT